MSETNPDRFYHLLPDLYCWRDQRQGESLRTFLAVIERELLTVEADMAAQHNNWFIQTCDPWAIAYIADLLGVRHVADQVQQLPFNQRRLVANTVAYRRRKGTLVILEQVAWDVTHWHVHVVEFEQLLAATQHLQHLRPDRAKTAHLHQTALVCDADGPFTTLAHSADVRRAALPQTPTPTAVAQEQASAAQEASAAPHRLGKYNRNNIGLFFWRLQSYPVKKSYANIVPDHPGCFHFSRNGDIPLFHDPQSFASITQMATAVNMPMKLTRAALAADLDEFTVQYSKVPTGEHSLNSKYYGPDRGLNVLRNGKPIPPSKVVSMNLQSWPELSKITNWDAQKEVAIDVELGRVAFFEPFPKSIDVVNDFAYGFSDDIGGGPYPRHSQIDEPVNEHFEIHVAIGGVTGKSWQGKELLASFRSGDTLKEPSVVGSLRMALACWYRYCKNRPTPCKGFIRILDNGVYKIATIPLTAQGDLTIIADNGVQPTIIAPRRNNQASIKLMRDRQTSPNSTESTFNHRLCLNGLRVEQPIELSKVNQAEANRLDLKIDHCTLMHTDLSFYVPFHDSNFRLTVQIDHSIVGPLCLPDPADLSITDSIVDYNGGSGPAQANHTLAIAGSRLSVARATIFGAVKVAQLTQASEVIFEGTVTAVTPKDSCVQYSYFPTGSNIARPGNCPSPELQPVFTSRRYGQPGYAQLSLDCPPKIRRGAENGSEIGVFHHLSQPQREDNIGSMLDEYLPYGFEVGIFYVT